jgi:hemerythrin
MKTSDLLWQDTQHQELFQMTDELKASDDIGVSLLERLSEYVRHHFSLEEKHMEVCGFPREKAEIHIHAHRMFERKIESIAQSQHIVAQGLKNDRFRTELVEFLEHWLETHVMGLDKELEAHVLKSSIR